MYVRRDAAGQIIVASRDMTPECQEFVAANSPELMLFLSVSGESRSDALLQSDLDFVRVLEDVITVLMDKGVISFTDLPEPAQQKLLDRQSLRQRMNSVGLMSDSDDSGVI